MFPKLINYLGLKLARSTVENVQQKRINLFFLPGGTVKSFDVSLSYSGWHFKTS